MATAYHIDRQNSLKVNQTIELVKYDPACQGSIQFRMSKFSAHGAKYADHYNNIRNQTHGIFGVVFMNDAQMEHLLEVVRFAQFRNLPSRMQSMFCVSTIDELHMWISKLDAGIKPYSIWEIEYNSDRSVQLDSRFLRGNTLSGISEELGLENYIRYWSGVRSESPLMELLVELPVKVVRRIT